MNKNYYWKLTLTHPELCIHQFIQEYRFLSNFWQSGHIIYLDGKEYSSVEHAYQAAKTLDPVERINICDGSAADAKKAGRACTIRDDWEAIKVPIMGQLLQQKFNPIFHPKLAEQLFETKGKVLIEGNHWGDTFWGVCDKEGYNHLGILLMTVREGLKL